MGKNINMIANFLEKRFTRPIVLTKPWKVFIEVSLSCNLRCITCTHSKIIYGGIMKDKVFERTKPVFSRARIIHEVGFGEPFLNKTFLAKLEYLKKSDIFIGIITNGTLITKQIAERLVALQLDQVTFSIDGGTKQTFEAIRVGARFSEVLENIGTLYEIKIRERSNKPFMRVNFVAMRRNIHELPEMIRILAKIGIKEISVQNLSPQDSEAVKECLYYYDKDTVTQLLEESRKVANQCRVNLIAPPYFPKLDVPPALQNLNELIEKKQEHIKCGAIALKSLFDENNDSKSIQDLITLITRTDGSTDGKQTDNGETRASGEANKNKSVDSTKVKVCYEPWQTTYVTYDGHVRPCCAMGESFGNLLDSSFEEIWNSKKLQLLRRTVNSKNPAFIECRDCYLRNKNVHLPLRTALSMLIRSFVNLGFVNTTRRTIKFLLEYV